MSAPNGQELRLATKNKIVQRSWRQERKLTDKQCLALDYSIQHPNPITLYGGGGFGGKSYLLRAAIVEFCGLFAQLGHPGQWGGLFCSTYNQLQDRHIAELASELAHLGQVKESTQRGLCFEFNDKSLGGCYLRNLDNPAKYKGASMSFLLVDELTEISKGQFEDLLYLRPKEKLPFFPVLCASNPDGPGHSWVKKFWIEEDFKNENHDPTRFFFVPALPQDNPTWEGNVQVQAVFDSLPPHLKKARLEGSWDAPSGARFPQLSHRHQFKFMERFPYGVPVSYPIVMGMDWGGKAPYCALWIAIDEESNLWVFREDYKAGLTTDVMGSRIVKLTAENEYVHTIYADNQMWQEKKDYSKLNAPSVPSFKKVIEDAISTSPKFGRVAQGFKPKRSKSLGNLDLFFNLDNGYPNIYISEDCVELWRELTGAVWDERGIALGIKEDIDPRSPDHAISALYYVANTYIQGVAPEAMPLPTPHEAMVRRHEELIKKEEKEFRKIIKGLNR